MEKFWNNPLVAFTYNLFTRMPPTKKLHRTIADVILEKPANLLVEIGSGTGALIEKLTAENQAMELVGIEPSKRMLSKAMKLAENPKVHFVRAVGEHPPLRDQSVPLIVLVFSYHHLSDPKKTIEASFQTLKPGGSIIIFEADPTLDKKQVKKAYKTIGLPAPLAILAQKYLRKTGHAVDPAQIRDSLKPFLNKGGFTVHKMIKGTPVSAVEITRKNGA